MKKLADPFGRQIKYLRLSVTDRCDFRCIYCMTETMRFAPRADVLSLEELALVARTFKNLGVEKIRITGGEPLVRNNVLRLCKDLGALNVRELALTTNGSRLEQFAVPLKNAGIHRINISLDSLRPERFRELSRVGNLSATLRGIDAALNAGFQGIKLNVVVLKGWNEEEVPALLNFALQRDLDISFIEEMPLGKLQRSRLQSFCSSEEIKTIIAQDHTLKALKKDDPAAGPSRYFVISGKKSRIGFISPHSENFCASCNRVRVTATGRLLLCLGNEHSADLRAVLRNGQANPEEALRKTICEALENKPWRHHFKLDSEPQTLRFMNATGG